MARPPKTTRLKALATYKLLAARVRVVLGTTKVQSSTVNALARVAAMAAVGKQNVFSASVKASLLVAGAKTGRFFTLLNVADAFSASDVRNFSIFKLRVDEVQAVDRALAEVFKTLSDAAITADQVNLLAGKGLVDLTATADLVIRDSTKLLTDTHDTSDAALLAAAKQLDDIVSAGDFDDIEFGAARSDDVAATEATKFGVARVQADSFAASELATRDFGSQRQDAFVVGDSNSIEAGKRLFDSATTADLFDRTVAFVRFFDDVADAGDEINANLLTDDGQVVFLDKAIRDVALTSIRLDFDVAKARADTFAADDVALLSMGKPLEDTYSTASQTFLATDKSLTDTPDTSDALTRASTKRLDSGAETVTQLEFDLAALRSDAATAFDAALLAAAKQFDDLVGVGDFNDVEFGAVRNDLVVTAEATVFDTTKLLQNTVAALDTPARSFSKALFDSVTVTDSMRLFFEAFYNTGIVTSEEVQVIRIAAEGVPEQRENQTATDITALGVNKRFADAVKTTDDFFGAANLDDDQITFVGKNLTENLTATELRTVALQRTLQESAGATSSGLLAMTDYCDSTYFSQAYVGTERIFS